MVIMRLKEFLDNARYALLICGVIILFSTFALVLHANTVLSWVVGFVPILIFQNFSMVQGTLSSKIIIFSGIAFFNLLSYLIFCVIFWAGFRMINKSNSLPVYVSCVVYLLLLFVFFPAVN